MHFLCKAPSPKQNTCFWGSHKSRGAQCLIQLRTTDQRTLSKVLFLSHTNLPGRVVVKKSKITVLTHTNKQMKSFTEIITVKDFQSPCSIRILAAFLIPEQGICMAEARNH
uniref:Uncharacterized protein n=1 Tax=Sphaerodactylus townsendi TaxID=933632 RepID=A0ACB8F3W3_9SAUR